MENDSIRMVRDYQEYRKRFPWYFLGKERNAWIWKAGIAAGLFALFSIPVKSRIKIPAGIVTAFCVKLAKDRLPGKIREDYENYLGQVGKHTRYLFAPEIRKVNLLDLDGSTLPAIETYAAGIPLMEFMEPYFAKEDQAVCRHIDNSAEKSAK